MAKRKSKEPLNTELSDADIDLIGISAEEIKQMDARSIELIKKEISKAKRSSKLLAMVKKYFTENYEVRYNTIAHEIELRKTGFNEVGEIFPWEIYNESEISVEFQSKNIAYGKEKTRDLLKSSFVKKHNPIKHYFEKIALQYPADHFKDNDTIKKLASYIKVTDREVFDLHFKKHLVRAVATIYKPGYFNKHCFTLIGKQNDGKTSFTRFLYPRGMDEGEQSYFTETFNPDKDKDSLIALCENFIINLDELAALNRAEINNLKSIFSKDAVKVRHPFDPKPTKTERTCTFFGSTNNKQVLSDDTGSVRWICFEIEGIDFEYSNEIDINEVWAQAFHLLNTDYSYTINLTEVLENEKRNEYFQMIKPERELLQKHFSACTQSEGGDFMQITDIHLILQQKASGSLRLNPITLGKVMSALKMDRVKHNSVWGYWLKENKI